MSKDRLGKAADHASALEAALPPPKPKRPRRIQLALSETEYARIEAFARGRDEHLAVALRNLVLTALDAMGK